LWVGPTWGKALLLTLSAAKQSLGSPARQVELE
jgi:hypothetical protein